jgi:hypothetical protein
MFQEVDIMEDKSNLYIVAIVGIVAVLALVVIISGMGRKQTVMTSQNPTGQVMLMPTEEETSGNIAYNSASQYVCTDTDPANSVFIAGTTTVKDSRTGSVVKSYPDMCSCYASSGAIRCKVYQIRCDASNPYKPILESTYCPAITAEGRVYPGGMCLASEDTPTQGMNVCMNPIVKTNIVLASGTTIVAD